ncbi:helix-turn-helix domain-containing protein [Bacteroides uniformis]|uniref:helix-turn-helix domain-containing protein n=1 Tax=Bacteroides uniformis TaxID=820 RepID=UPI00233ED056|nr:helix-turn-helix domain-containing protein [Bacteroides uniformis]MDC1809356.1 helix-turn-helix domain-containing protein [Bacteroides uniformis]
MNDNVLTTDDEHIAKALNALRKGTREASLLAQNYRPPLNGERYMTDKEVAERLKVSRRTLQEYRNDRKIPFVIFGGKVLYRETDIERMLEENYRKAIR